MLKSTCEKIPVLSSRLWDPRIIKVKKTSKILKGRLPPEDGSDWRETLGKRVSDDFAKMIFRGQKSFGGSIFRKKSKILADRLPPKDGSDRRETLGKRVSDDFAKLIFRAEKTFGGRFFQNFRQTEGLKGVNKPYLTVITVNGDHR